MTIPAAQNDDSPGAGRILPGTPIAALFVRLNAFASLLTVGAALVGCYAAFFTGALAYHIPMGLAAVVLGLFGLVAAMFYLVVTGAAVKEAVVEKGISREYFFRTKPLKKTLFSFCMLTIGLLISMTVLGAAVHVKKAHWTVHLAFALATVVSYYVTIGKMKDVFQKDRQLIADVLEAIAAAPPPAQ